MASGGEIEPGENEEFVSRMTSADDSARYDEGFECAESDYAGDEHYTSSSEDEGREDATCRAEPRPPPPSSLPARAPTVGSYDSDLPEDGQSLSAAPPPGEDSSFDGEPEPTPRSMTRDSQPEENYSSDSGDSLEFADECGQELAESVEDASMGGEAAESVSEDDDDHRVLQRDYSCESLD